MWEFAKTAARATNSSLIWPFACVRLGIRVGFPNSLHFTWCLRGEQFFKFLFYFDQSINQSGPYCSLVNRSAKNGDTPVYEEPKPLTISLTLATRLTTTTTSTTPDPKQSALVCSQLVANPCRNGGTCVYSNQTRSFSCACPATYTDPLCGTRVAFCANNPCKNGGTCNQRAGELRGNCTCPSNYGGPTCEIILTCYPNPCEFVTLALV